MAHLLMLAPMYNVTDIAFRRIVAKCAPPDIFVTEFVNVDGLQSAGRDKLLPYLYQEKGTTPLLAQIWGDKPENFYKTAQELAAQGFAGIDLNMGCPDKTVVKHNQCSALIKPENRTKASEIISATIAGAQGTPVSVKTRLGFNQTDFTWHEFLLGFDLSMLVVHGRTRSEMSKVPARWDEIGKIKQIAVKSDSKTKIIGNGDIVSRKQAIELCLAFSWDGAMLGRAIFQDPFLFASNSPWSKLQPLEKINLYLQHLSFFKEAYPQQERVFEPLKKFMKVYINGFQGASDLRQQLAATKQFSDFKDVLKRSSRLYA